MYEIDGSRQNDGVKPYGKRGEAYRQYVEVIDTAQPETPFATVWGNISTVAADRAKLIVQGLNALGTMADKSPLDRQHTRLIKMLGDNLLMVYRELAAFEGVDLADDELPTLRFKKRFEDANQALQLFYQWNDGEGVFAPGADPRQGMPVENDPDLVWMRADEVRVGDALDLYGDRFADPDKDEGKSYEYEYSEVYTVERETEDTIVIGIDNAEVGFPFNHLLKVKRPK